MHVYCTKCRTQQTGTEKTCSKCGEPYGGERWVLVVWATLIIAPCTFIMLTKGTLNELLDIRVLLWYILPLSISASFLYDYHPQRRAIYFWGGSLIIIASIMMYGGR